MLVGHGTRDDRGTRQFFQLGQQLAQRVAPVPVQPCLLEFQQPTIPQAWSTLVQAGVRHIHVAPLLLFAAGHAKTDIPDLVKNCQNATPGISFDQSRPLARHPAIVELACKRFAESIPPTSVPPARTALVMVGRGSHDPCAQADMRVLTEVVRHRIPVAAAFTSFYAMAQPRLPDVIDAVAASGRYDAIVVQPHLLFDGRLFQAIAGQTQQARLRHPSVLFCLSSYLGPELQVARAIANRVGCDDSVV